MKTESKKPFPTDGTVVGPERDQRVLFYVPGEPIPLWYSDELDGEQGYRTYELDQVTHWMPMPGEPT